MFLHYFPSNFFRLKIFRNRGAWNGFNKLSSNAFCPALLPVDLNNSPWYYWACCLVLTVNECCKQWHQSKICLSLRYLTTCCAGTEKLKEWQIYFVTEPLASLAVHPLILSFIMYKMVVIGQSVQSRWYDSITLGFISIRNHQSLTVTIDKVTLSYLSVHRIFENYPKTKIGVLGVAQQ